MGPWIQKVYHKPFLFEHNEDLPIWSTGSIFQNLLHKGCRLNKKPEEPLLWTVEDAGGQGAAGLILGGRKSGHQIGQEPGRKPGGHQRPPAAASVAIGRLIAAVGPCRAAAKPEAETGPATVKAAQPDPGGQTLRQMRIQIRAQ